MMIFGKCVHTVSIIRRNLVRAAKSRLRGYHGGKEKVKKRICIYIYMYRPLVLFSDKSERNTRYEG